MQEPLITISNYVNIFSEDYKEHLDTTGQLYLRFISEASQRMSFLVKGLMDYSLIGTHGKPEWTDSEHLIQYVLSENEAKIKETEAKIEFQALPTIYGYKAELSMLFNNLISNALKFQEAGKRPEIEVGVESTETHWEFYVKDNGIGIPKKLQEKIFIIFQRLHSKSSFEGTGIGLAHCRKIAELHNGKIWVESTEGKGSTFKFTIKKR